MSQIRASLRANIVYGLVLLVPFGIVVLLLTELVDILDAVSVPIAEAYDLRDGASVAIALLIAVLLLMLACFMLGFLMRTRIGAWSFERVERTLLRTVPGYRIVSSLLKGFAEGRTAYRPALLHLHGPGVGVFGFVMDENEHGDMTVFVPSAPTLTVGAVYVAAPDRVTLLDVPAADVTRCLTEWGTGSRELVERLPS